MPPANVTEYSGTGVRDGVCNVGGMARQNCARPWKTSDQTSVHSFIPKKNSSGSLSENQPECAGSRFVTVTWFQQFVAEQRAEVWFAAVAEQGAEA